MRLGLGIGVPYESGVLYSDKLSLDLQFATDKTLTARKGPTPTLTRGSGTNGGVTYVGPIEIIVNGNLSVPLFQTSNILGGRFWWTSLGGGPGMFDYQTIYNGTRWAMRIRYWIDGEENEETNYLAALGSEWRPDDADWSGTGITVVAGNTMGIVKAADNEPRFNHDPVTLACKGLLIEESRTNLALQSETFPLPTWSKSNVTTSPNTIASPSGTVSADTLNEGTDTSFHYIFQQFAKAASSLTYSYSIYYKNASGTRTVVLALTNGTTSGKAAIFTTSGTITATNINIGSGAGFTFVSANVESIGNGWYRASIVVTSDTSTRLDAVAYLNNSTTVINSYTGSMSSVYLWGAQLEAGSFPTSYIPTTTASVVRSADVCSITGSDFTGFYNQSEGTIVGSGLTNQPTTNAGAELFRSNDGTNNNRVQVGMTNFPAQAVRPFIVTSGTVTYSSTQGTATVGVERKVGTAYKTNDAISAFNGTLGTLDTTVTPPTNCNQVALFSGLGSGTISSLRYFKKRLPDAKLQTLTV